MVTTLDDMAAANAAMWRASFDTADPLHLVSETADQRRHQQHRHYQDRDSLEQAQSSHSPA